MVKHPRPEGIIHQQIGLMNIWLEYIRNQEKIMFIDLALNDKTSYDFTIKTS